MVSSLKGFAKIRSEAKSETIYPGRKKLGSREHRASKKMTAVDVDGMKIEGERFCTNSCTVFSATGTTRHKNRYY